MSKSIYHFNRRGVAGLFYKHFCHSIIQFWGNVHLQQCVTFHVSHVAYNNFHLCFDQVLELVGEGSVINSAYPV